MKNPGCCSHRDSDRQFMTPPMPSEQEQNRRDLSLFAHTLPNGDKQMDFAVEGIDCAACIDEIEDGTDVEAGEPLIVDDR